MGNFRDIVIDLNPENDAGPKPTVGLLIDMLRGHVRGDHCLEENDDVPANLRRDYRWVAADILTLIGDEIESLQPSPPEDEPDEATIERVAEAIAMAGTSHFGDDTPYAQQNHLVKMMRRYEAKAAIEAYGLAVRSKIEDKS